MGWIMGIIFMLFIIGVASGDDGQNTSRNRRKSYGKNQYKSKKRSTYSSDNFYNECYDNGDDCDYSEW